MKPLLKFLINHIKRIGAAPALPESVIGDPESVQAWKELLSKYNKRIETIEDKQVKMYGIIFGQCKSKVTTNVKRRKLIQILYGS